MGEIPNPRVRMCVVGCAKLDIFVPPFMKGCTQKVKYGRIYYKGENVQLQGRADDDSNYTEACGRVREATARGLNVETKFGYKQV